MGDRDETAMFDPIGIAASLARTGRTCHPIQHSVISRTAGFTNSRYQVKC
jgi:hypothetical protein